MQKPTPKPTQVLKMAAWLEKLSLQNPSVEVSFDQSPVKTFTKKNWQDLVESIRSNAEAKMVDLVIHSKRNSATQVTYAVYQDKQWQSMPAKDVELLYSVDVEKLEYARPEKNLSFASFKDVYPDSPVRKELVDLGARA